jgi:hypothetical protein
MYNILNGGDKMKKIISVLLCAILVTSSILSVNAAELSSENREFVCTGETLTMEDNTFMVFANGIDVSFQIKQEKYGEVEKNR